MRSANKHFKILRFALAACLATSYALASDAGYVLTSSTPSTWTSVVTGGSWRWSHGAFILVDMVAPLTKTFTVVNRDGSISSTWNFSIPDTSQLWVFGYDRDPAGDLVAAGEAYSYDGRLAPFIAIKPAKSGEVQIIRTYPYWPALLAVAPDGTIWTAGDEMNYERTYVGVNRNGDAIRHFDRTGKLLGSGVPGLTVHPVWRSHDGYLVATNERVGWYGPIKGAGTYVELPTSHPSDYKVYPGLGDKKGEADGFALTDSGKAFVTHYAQEKQTTYLLDHVSGQWNEVSFPGGDPRMRLEGSEKETLVFEDPKGLVFYDTPQSLASR
ncbi:MAG TPA: hypothetical protein VHU83_18915 [Bryobacteraceae bacterium]|jgi:hypothetical protein|nr:hypothetical protein [Bryobacteraceae bacterium]